MTTKLVSGGSLAIAAIALVVNGAALTSASATSAKTVHCVGINSCKGTSACKTAENACKGQNTCKGHGWLPVKSKASCEKKGGTVG